jgi:hypothetical protein
MTPAECRALGQLSNLALHHAHLLVDAREAGDELGATRHDHILKAVCEQLVPLLHQWGEEGSPHIPHIADVTEQMEIDEFRLRPDGRGYEPR